MESTKDVPMKVSILYNTCFDHKESASMRAKDVAFHEIKKPELKKLMRESSDRRYIVSITREKNGDEDKIGGFEHEIGDWYISAGFKNTRHNPVFKQLVPPGVNNAVLTSEGENGVDGAYVVTGPGAGKEPTRTAMLIDAKNILQQKVRGKRI